ncbi:MAG: SRPBCC domain-containing protein [Gammaproteobacteria bacterium]|nr:SRPBCC domain-containing protein [Gammaproteobacteria bacterium]
MDTGKSPTRMEAMVISAQPIAAVEIARIFNAPRQNVYEAWSSSEILEQWMGPGDDMETHVEAFDLRAGGAYRFRMIARRDDPATGPAGTHYVVGGRCVEIKAPERLAFTWRWLENGMDIGQSLVKIELRDFSNRTELVIVHAGLPTPEAREAHREGWEACLDCLARYLAGQQA